MNLSMTRAAFLALPLREEHRHRDPYNGELFRCNEHAVMASFEYDPHKAIWYHFNVTFTES